MTLVCPDCRKEFKLISDLSSKCDICGAVHQSRDGLILNHPHDSRRRVYVCKGCTPKVTGNTPLEQLIQ